MLGVAVQRAATPILYPGEQPPRPAREPRSPSSAGAKFLPWSGPVPARNCGPAVTRARAWRYRMFMSTLYIVSTPIGNLGDITYRAVEVLSSVRRVLAEDTRRTAILFRRYDIRTPLVSMHAHNEAARTARVLEWLASGEDLALVSDAGTPLLSDPGGRVVREVTDANELMAALDKKKPALLLLNLHISGKNGLEILKDINMLYPNIPVLVYSQHSEDKFAIRALKAGASGYFSKSGTSNELIMAIRLIVDRKKRYVSPEVADQIAQYYDSTENSMLHEKLSDREYLVLCKIASGKRISNIAKELSLSVQTIHTYRSRLKEKMNMTTDTELTKYAIQNNLID